MLLSTAAWAASEISAVRGADPAARRFYTAALALALVHVALAFHLAYAWSHSAAVAATARQTAALTGIDWGGGVWINYLFLSVWLADACWWWLAPASRRARSRALETTRLGLFVFMFVNGAVVFAAGVGRVTGAACVATVLAAAAWRQRRAAVA